MFNTQRRLLKIVIAGVMMTSCPVFAQSFSLRNIGTEDIPANHPENVDITLDIADGRDVVRIDDHIAFCFQVNQSGYISLWDIGTSGDVTRIYPLSGQDEQKITANRQHCVGDDIQTNNGRKRYKVYGPTGTENVIAYWTKDREAQIEATRYQNAKAFTNQLMTSAKRNNSFADWATAKVTFKIIGQNAAEPNVIDNLGQLAKTVSDYDNVYVIAFAANVGELKKTNDDAELFVEMMKETFDIPKRNIRLYKDAYRHDFEEGFQWVGNKADSNDLVLFYFSGHGTRIPDDNNEEADGYDEAIVPYELADPSNYDRADKYIRDDELRKWLGGIHSGAVITVFDSCFSGGMYKGFSQGDLLNARTKFFNKGNFAGKLPQFKGGKATGLQPERNIIIDDVDSLGNGKTKYTMVSAVKEEQQAIELQGQGGIFTLALYDALQKGQPSRSWADMTELLSRNLSRESQGRQVPTIIDPDKSLEELKLD